MALFNPSSKSALPMTCKQFNTIRRDDDSSLITLDKLDYRLENIIICGFLTAHKEINGGSVFTIFDGTDFCEAIYFHPPEEELCESMKISALGIANYNNSKFNLRVNHLQPVYDDDFLTAHFASVLYANKKINLHKSTAAEANFSSLEDRILNYFRENNNKEITEDEIFKLDGDREKILIAVQKLTDEFFIYQIDKGIYKKT